MTDVLVRRIGNSSLQGRLQGSCEHGILNSEAKEEDYYKSRNHILKYYLILRSKISQNISIVIG